MTKEEHETIVTLVRTDDTVGIYTSDPRYIRRVRKDDRFTIVKEHTEDGETVAVDVTVSADQFDPLKGLKRRSKPLTEERRKELSERMRNLHR